MIGRCFSSFDYKYDGVGSVWGLEGGVWVNMVIYYGVWTCFDIIINIWRKIFRDKKVYIYCFKFEFIIIVVNLVY